MGLFRLWSSVFSLDTLDYRLTVNTAQSSSPPANRAAAESAESRHVREGSIRPKWKTLEFFLYYIAAVIFVPWMFKVAYDMSNESHPNFDKYRHLLWPGWIFGRKVDNSDRQYANFRNNLPILFAVLLLHFVLRRAFNVVFIRVSPTPPSNSSYLPSHNLTRRKLFDIFFALIFLTALHSLSVLKIVFIIVVNFLISFFHPSSDYVPILTWLFNIGVLFANEYYSGYRFQVILPWLTAGEGAGVGYAMDNFMGGGILRRWHISFNITVLRLISYNMDHYWAAVRKKEGNDIDGTVIEKMRSYPANLNEKDRVDMPAKMQDYSLLNYMAYVLYTPLYLAGPIITFNDFIHQQKYSTPSLRVKRTLLYAIRLVFAILCMEVVLHYFYVVAISKTSSLGSWANDTPAQLAVIGYFNLHIIWLKLLIPWRFFRLWALIDGVDPPENMLRCMSNNNSTLAFWRGWHRSFNRWIVRYIYVPIGGSERPLINMAAVFTFVALWHDLSFKLLAWGWLVVLFVIPELFARKVFKPSKFQGRKTLFRHMCALGGVCNVLMMMAANLVGFAIGIEGLMQLIHGVFNHFFSGVAFIILALFTIFVTVQIMMEIREEERRNGINMKC